MKVLTDKVILGKDLEIGRKYVLVSCHEQVSDDENSMHFVMRASLVDDIPLANHFYEVEVDESLAVGLASDVFTSGIKCTTSDEFFIGASANNLIEDEKIDQHKTWMRKSLFESLGERRFEEAESFQEETKSFHQEEEYKELSDFDKKIFESLNRNLGIEILPGGRDMEYMVGVTVRFNGMIIHSQNL